MNKRPIETLMGLFVIGVTAVFLIFAHSKIEFKIVEGYPLTVQFQKAGGLENGSDVRISGIKVGSVTSRKLDDNYMAVVDLTIKKDVKLPVDTVAAIGGDGIMGDKFINLIPGKSKDVLKAGDQIAKVKDFKSLEDSVSEIIFLATKDPKEAMK